MKKINLLFLVFVFFLNTFNGNKKNKDFSLFKYIEKNPIKSIIASVILYLIYNSFDDSNNFLGNSGINFFNKDSNKEFFNKKINEDIKINEDEKQINFIDLILNYNYLYNKNNLKLINDEEKIINIDNGIQDFIEKNSKQFNDKEYDKFGKLKTFIENAIKLLRDDCIKDKIYNQKINIIDVKKQKKDFDDSDNQIENLNKTFLINQDNPFKDINIYDKENKFLITGKELNKWFKEYIKLKENKENKIAISQMTKLNTEGFYIKNKDLDKKDLDKDENKNKNKDKEVLLISAWGDNKNGHHDEMHKQIFDEFYKFIEKDENKKYALFMPTIGLGIYNGTAKRYWDSMIKMLKENKKLFEKIEKKKVYIFYNPTKDQDWDEYKNAEENKENIKFINDVKWIDIYNLANEFKDKTDFEVAILNPSDERNVNCIKSLGSGGGGEGYISKATYITLNTFFEELYDNLKKQDNEFEKKNNQQIKE